MQLTEWKHAGTKLFAMKIGSDGKDARGLHEQTMVIDVSIDFALDTEKKFASMNKNVHIGRCP